MKTTECEWVKWTQRSWNPYAVAHKCTHIHNCEKNKPKRIKQGPTRPLHCSINRFKAKKLNDNSKQCPCGEKNICSFSKVLKKMPFMWTLTSLSLVQDIYTLPIYYLIYLLLLWSYDVPIPSVTFQTAHTTNQKQTHGQKRIWQCWCAMQ